MLKAIVNFFRKLTEPKPGQCPKAVDYAWTTQEGDKTRSHQPSNAGADPVEKLEQAAQASKDPAEPRLVPRQRRAARTAGGKKTAKPTGGKKTAKPTTGKKTAKPAGGKKTVKKPVKKPSRAGAKTGAKAAPAAAAGEKKN